MGLADPARLFLVPGNHDRYAGRYLPISNQITNFESVFGDRFGNRGRPRAAGWLTSRDLRLRVLAIDSMGDAGWASVAKGKVHDDDLDWLQTVYDDDTRRESTAISDSCCCTTTSRSPTATGSIDGRSSRT